MGRLALAAIGGLRRARDRENEHACPLSRVRFHDLSPAASPARPGATRPAGRDSLCPSWSFMPTWWTS